MLRIIGIPREVSYGNAESKWARRRRACAPAAGEAVSLRRSERDAQTAGVQRIGGVLVGVASERAGWKIAPVGKRGSMGGTGDIA